MTDVNIFKNLESEILKLEMKFSYVEGANSPHDFLDFFVRYCSTAALKDMIKYDGEERIAVCIHKFKQDITGSSRPGIVQNTYPFSLSGLEEVRNDALSVVTKVYSLPQGIQIEDVNYVPEPKEGFDFNKIYRVSTLEILKQGMQLFTKH
ncbi:MAG: hypothetical protein Q8O89_08300 [Nanoarchaeota archaeon]|nr:hypothetical protein [Nanoarchaeota archaeon]